MEALPDDAEVVALEAAFVAALASCDERTTAQASSLEEMDAGLKALDDTAADLEAREAALRPQFKPFELPPLKTPAIFKRIRTQGGQPVEAPTQGKL